MRARREGGASSPQRRVGPADSRAAGRDSPNGGRIIPAATSARLGHRRRRGAWHTRPSHATRPTERASSRPPQARASDITGAVAHGTRAHRTRLAQRSAHHPGRRKRAPRTSPAPWRMAHAPTARDSPNGGRIIPAAASARLGHRRRRGAWHTRPPHATRPTGGASSRPPQARASDIAGTVAHATRVHRTRLAQRGAHHPARRNRAPRTSPAAWRMARAGNSRLAQRPPNARAPTPLATRATPNAEPPEPYRPVRLNTRNLKLLARR